MVTPSANLFVCSADQLALIKITGRATFSLSNRFKALVEELRGRGAENFVLDLSGCATMDSTFLGVLAGMALEIANGDEKPSRPVLEIVRPNARIVDLLENLGIAHFFKPIESSPVPDAELTAAPCAPIDPTKAELSKLSLEAHETLMAVNPDNIPKFKDVAHFLAEDLKKSGS